MPRRFGTWLAQHLDKRKRDVSQRRHMGTEVERLKHHADLTPHRVDVGGTRRDIDPADVHRAGRWLLQTVAATQQGTLACSRGSDDKHQFLRHYEKVNAAQYLDVVEFFAETADLQDGRGAGRHQHSRRPQRPQQHIPRA